MKIAVLFDGAGLARLGLEQAGHDCIGYELDPWKHYLGLMVGSGNSVLTDATTVDLSGFDAVWASPPCQSHSKARSSSAAPLEIAGGSYLAWSLALVDKVPVLWVENVFNFGTKKNAWGRKWNAAQFLEQPIQSRPRLVGGNYVDPHIFRKFQHEHTYLCPTITASEHKGGAHDTRRASRFYGRRLSLQECAYHQGFTIPEGWWDVPPLFRPFKWREVLYEAIGNGVPPYMAKAFGDVYSPNRSYGLITSIAKNEMVA